MRIGLMQPYFLPYLGYFQLINSVDKFVIYDNIQFEKGGWINRNRILLNDSWDWISIPLKKGSDYSNINERFLADNYLVESKKLLRRIEGAYIKAPFFTEFFPLVENVFKCREDNLFKYVFNSITSISKYLKITTAIYVSSELPDSEKIMNAKSAAKVMTICKKLEAREYINPIGGLELYSKEAFQQDGVEIKFLKMKSITYPQFGENFVSNLSILDVLMFNSRDYVAELLNQFELI